MNTVDHQTYSNKFHDKPFQLVHPLQDIFHSNYCEKKTTTIKKSSYFKWYKKKWFVSWIIYLISHALYHQAPVCANAQLPSDQESLSESNVENFCPA